MAAQIFSAMLRNCIELKLRKYLGRTKMAIGEIDSGQILKDVPTKNLEATLLFVDFSKVFDSIHRGKMEQILSL